MPVAVTRGKFFIAGVQAPHAGQKPLEPKRPKWDAVPRMSQLPFCLFCLTFGLLGLVRVSALHAEDFTDFVNKDGETIRGQIMGWDPDGNMNFMRQDNQEVYTIPFTYWDDATRQRLLPDAIEAFDKANMFEITVEPWSYEGLRPSLGPQTEMDGRSRSLFDAWDNLHVVGSRFTSGIIRVTNNCPIILEDVRVQVMLFDRWRLRSTGDLSLDLSNSSLLSQSPRLRAQMDARYQLVLPRMVPGETCLILLPPGYPTFVIHRSSLPNSSRTNVQALEEGIFRLDARMVVLDRTVDEAMAFSEEPDEDDEADPDDDEADTGDAAEAAIDVILTKVWPEPFQVAYPKFGKVQDGVELTFVDEHFEADPWTFMTYEDGEEMHLVSTHLNKRHRLWGAENRHLMAELVSLRGEQVKLIPKSGGSVRSVPLSAFDAPTVDYIKRWDLLKSLAFHLDFRLERNRKDHALSSTYHSYRDMDTITLTGAARVNEDLRRQEPVLVMVAVNREKRRFYSGRGTVERVANIYRQFSSTVIQDNLNNEMIVEMDVPEYEKGSMQGVWLGLYVYGALLGSAAKPEGFNPWAIEYESENYF
ncbi:MAG: hypothetical protein ACFBZ8_00585 [Opitutales bacterium]